MEAGNILLFQNFRFANGNTPKAKFFIVLKGSYQDDIVVASLPTKVSHIPKGHEKSHGCISDDAIRLNAYCFAPGKPVTKCGWSFDLPTHVYGEEVDVYSVEMIKSNYKENIDYKLIGELTDEELKGLLECISTSACVKRKVQRLLK